MLSPIFHPMSGQWLLGVIENHVARPLSLEEIKQHLAEHQQMLLEKSTASGLALIANERVRQISVEGWTPEHDDNHGRQELALAAATYATPSPCRRIGPAALMQAHCVPDTWPWSAQWWKPNHDDRIRELVKAGALIAAEIDRLQRKAVREHPAA